MNLLIVILIFAFAAAFFEDFIVNKQEYYLISAFGSVFLVLLYYLSRFKKVFLPVAIALFVFLIFVLSPIIWFESGLRNSILPFLFVILVVFVTFIFEGKLRTYFLALSIVLLGIYSFVEISSQKNLKASVFNHYIVVMLTVFSVASIIFFSISKLKNEQKLLEELSKRDYLTKLFTRREGMERLDYSVEYAKRKERELSLIMLDLDDFKKVNDNYGHICGDKVLKMVADIIKSKIRHTDIAMRWGGEEFLIVLPETSASLAYLIAERIRVGVEAARMECAGKELSITITCGVSSYDFNNSINDNVNEADKAMYLGKKRGKNRTVII